MTAARPLRPTSAPRRLLTGVAVVGSLLLTACTGSTMAADDRSAHDPGTSSAESEPSRTSDPVEPVRVRTKVGAKPEAVPVDTVVRVHSSQGRLRTVEVASGRTGKLSGRLSENGYHWRATEELEPGTTYVVRSTSVRRDGTGQRDRSTFSTEDLTLDRQTYPSVAPLDGETVGVGMPVVVSFDLAVRDKAAFERRMTVTSRPAQKGSWHWLSDHEAHWRPARYWQAGTDVTVDVAVNSVAAGGGIYGQESRQVRFHVGDAVISRVDAQSYQMRTYVNGALVKTTPITTGKPGFTTRSGVKVIMEKFRTRRMASETIGITSGPDAYDIPDVEYAMRLTYSGEFLHAAPWSVGSQGYANVSHGCTGMSTADAAWLYSISKRGDVVEYTGTDRWMDLYNGYGDWNAPFADYAEGSALA